MEESVMRTLATIAATLGVIGAIAVGSAVPAAAWYGYHRYHHHHYGYYPYYHRHVQQRRPVPRSGAVLQRGLFDGDVLYPGRRNAAPG